MLTHTSQSPAPVLGRRSVVGLVAALGLTAAVSGCGSSAPTLNTSATERAAAASILAQRHLHVTVSCPPNVPKRAGYAFTCVAHLNVGEYPVQVTETNGSGHVQYQSQAPLATLNTAKVEQAINQSILSQRHLSSVVTCPAEVIQRAGIVFTCTATVNGRAYHFAVTEVDGNGHVRYVGH